MEQRGGGMLKLVVRRRHENGFGIFERLSQSPINGPASGLFQKKAVVEIQKRKWHGVTTHLSQILRLLGMGLRATRRQGKGGEKAMRLLSPTLSSIGWRR